METQIETINYLTNNESIIKYFSESDEIFNDRIELLKKLELEKIPYKDALKLTKIYIFIIKFFKSPFKKYFFYILKII